LRRGGDGLHVLLGHRARSARRGDRAVVRRPAGRAVPRRDPARRAGAAGGPCGHRWQVSPESR
jgi:hypothetical protein